MSDFRVLRKSKGIVGGNMFEPGKGYDLQKARSSSLSIIIDNGMPAPDLIEMVYNLFLMSAFGDSGSKPLVVTPREMSEANVELANVYLDTLESLLDIQNKLSYLGRIYMTYGDIKIIRMLRNIGGVPLTTYKILDEPYNLERVELDNRLIGYFDTISKSSYSPDDVIHVFNRASIEKRNVEVSLSKNNIETESSGLSISISEQGSATKYRCEVVQGISQFATCAGILDIYPIKMANMINDAEVNKPKALVMVNTGSIKDVGMRNQVFSSIVSSCKSDGSFSYVEITDGVTVDVSPVTESTVNQAVEDLNAILELACMHSFLSIDVLKGEKSIFEDYRSKMIINDMRSAITEIVHKILSNEFGRKSAESVIVAVRSSLPEESDTALDTLQRGTELMTSVSDMAELLKMELKDTALPYISNKLGIDFTSLLRSRTEEEEIKREAEGDDE